jgi:hypothetical protein
MGNVLTNCPNNGVLLSSVKLNDPNGTCGIVQKVNYVAVGEGEFTIATSIDGQAWTGVSSVLLSVSGIAYGNDIWIAVGGSLSTGMNNNIAISKDGYIWNTQQFPKMIALNVAYGDNKWVITIQQIQTTNNLLLSNDNGMNWEYIVLNMFVVYDVAFGENFSGINSHLWVVTGDGEVSISSDCIKWISKMSNLPNKVNCVAFGKDNLNKNLCVVGGDSNGILWMNTIATSYDGTTWVSRSKIINIVKGITYNNSNLWIAVGDGPIKIASSRDGAIWTGITSGINNIVLGNGIIFANNLWIFGGLGGDPPASEYNIMTGTQVDTTIKWSTTGKDIGMFNNVNKIAYRKPKSIYDLTLSIPILKSTNTTGTYKITTSLNIYDGLSNINNITINSSSPLPATNIQFNNIVINGNIYNANSNGSGNGKYFTMFSLSSLQNIPISSISIDINFYVWKTNTSSINFPCSFIFSKV